eukprot:360484-Chlamydomonas_euryale.AAC.8
MFEMYQAANRLPSRASSKMAAAVIARGPGPLDGAPPALRATGVRHLRHTFAYVESMRHGAALAECGVGHDTEHALLAPR